MGKETSPVALGDCPAAQPPGCRKAEAATKKEGAEGTQCPAPTLDTLKSSPEKETSAGAGQTPQTTHTGGRVPRRRSSLGSSCPCWRRAVLQGKPCALPPGARAALAPSGCGFATQRGFAPGRRECRHTPARAARAESGSASSQLALVAARGLSPGALGLIPLQLPQRKGSAAVGTGRCARSRARCHPPPHVPADRVAELHNAQHPKARCHVPSLVTFIICVTITTCLNTSRFFGFFFFSFSFK